MNIQEYISSGIVESYVLGLAEPDERAEFEKMSAQHQSIREARDLFEQSLERFMISQSVQPPESVRPLVLKSVAISHTRISEPLANGGATLVRMVNRLRYLTAAAVILLVTSAALNFYLFSQYKSYSSRYEAMLARNTEMAQATQAMQTQLKDYESALTVIRNPDMAVIKMAGQAVPTSPAPASAATIYWNTRTKDVYVLVNNMPPPAADRQYQLWAIVDGQPVDAGVFDVSYGVSVVKMKNIPRAQAFAVTLEKRGGSPTPTVDQMYMLGRSS